MKFEENVCFIFSEQELQSEWKVNGCVMQGKALLLHFF